MKLKNFIYALACLAILFASCSDDEKENNVPSNVPEAVLKAFENKYGSIKEVQWEQKKTYHVAHIQLGLLTKSDANYATAVWFDEKGSEKQVNQEIEFSQLPIPVKTAFELIQSKLYADWKTDDIEIVSRLDMGLIYVIEIEKGKEERKLSFSPAGDLLKDVIDSDEDILPVIVPEEIKALLAKLFPDSKELIILEIETDDDETEVDILNNKQHYEIKVDNTGNWISTSYETDMSEAMTLIDPIVLSKLISLAQQAGIDLNNPEILKNTEVKVIDHTTKGRYFEVKIEIGDKELEVEIDKDGNIHLDD